MKAILSLAAAAALLALAGCGNIQWPPGCTQGDYSCLPCTYPQSTDPACAKFPTDAKKKSATAGGSNGAPAADRR